MMREVTIKHSDEGPERTLLFGAHGYVNEEHPIELTGSRVWQRQVGWLGASGNVYRFDEEPNARADEPGGYSPLYIDIGD